MSHGMEQVATIAVAIVGVAILATLVSKNSDTAKVIKSAGDAFSGGLATALSPIVGSRGVSMSQFG